MTRPRTRTERLLLVGRTAAEVTLATLFSLLAAETYAHRTFSPDVRYRRIVSAFALLVLALGFLPLIQHFFPKTGKTLFVGWLLLLAALVSLGLVTGSSGV